MMHNPAKRAISLLLVLLLLAAIPLAAYAADFDLAKTGSITVRLRDVYHPETAIGGTVRLHKVGDATVENSALTFIPTAEFADSGISLTDVNAAGLADELLAYAEEHDVVGTLKEADSTGRAAFTGLAAGLYLVSQETAVSGYYKVSPFLVSLPMYDAESGWNYSITAEPKVQRPDDDVSVTVYKKWVDNNRQRPSELVVQLLRDGSVVDEVVLSQRNDWSYTWDDLNSSYDWDVREKRVPKDYTVSYSRRGNIITITNKADWYVPPTDVLIQTGQLNWPVPVLFGLGLISMLLGLVLLKRREDNGYEA